MSITFIWAMGQNGVIGSRNGLPWHLPRDMAFFKEQTLGKTILMGRKTWESFGGKPLPKRTNVVLTRDPAYTAQGATVIQSLDEALKLAEQDDVMVIGGAEIYKLMLPYADCLLVTFIDETFEGDTFFPEVDWNAWTLSKETEGIRDEQNPYHYCFCTYVRKD